MRERNSEALVKKSDYIPALGGLGLTLTGLLTHNTFVTGIGMGAVVEESVRFTFFSPWARVQEEAAISDLAQNPVTIDLSWIKTLDNRGELE